MLMAGIPSPAASTTLPETVRSCARANTHEHKIKKEAKHIFFKKLPLDRAPQYVMRESNILSKRLPLRGGGGGGYFSPGGARRLKIKLTGNLPPARPGLFTNKFWFIKLVLWLLKKYVTKDIISRIKSKFFCES